MVKCIFCRTTADHLSGVNRALVFPHHHVLREHPVSVFKLLLLLYICKLDLQFYDSAGWLLAEFLKFLYKGEYCPYSGHSGLYCVVFS